MDCSPPGSSVHGTLQARVLEWGAIAFSIIDYTKAFNCVDHNKLENSMDGEVWRAAVHGVTKSRTRLSNFTFTFHFHALEKEMQPTPVFLPGESEGQRSLVGCRLWGHTESDTTEAT